MPFVADVVDFLDDGAIGVRTEGTVDLRVGIDQQSIYLVAVLAGLYLLGRKLQVF